MGESTARMKEEWADEMTDGDINSSTDYIGAKRATEGDLKHDGLMIPTQQRLCGRLLKEASIQKTDKTCM